MKPLRITSYNIHKGMSPLNRRHQMSKIADHLEQLDTDLLFLQEVQGHHARRARRFGDWPKQAQHQFLAQHLGWRSAYGLNATYRHGHHGNAILTRHAIQNWSNLDISVNRFEQRGVLHCEIALPDWPQPVAALCVHLNLLGRDRRKQFQHLYDYIVQSIPPSQALILAGDFNDWRGEACDHLGKMLGLTEVFQETHGRYARSFPARWPMLTLDRIYIRGLKTCRAEVLRGRPWSHLSDHLPLSAELLPLGANTHFASL